MSLCECGCGQPAPIAVKTSARFGHVQGQPVRYVRGHAMRGRKLSAETREKIGASQRGEKRPPEWGRKISAALTRSNNPAWTGGRIERERRVLVLVGRGQPMTDRDGYAYEHRVVMSRVLGRDLERDEHVHHIDCNPSNNRPENLIVLTPVEHRRVHNRIRAGLSAIEALTEVLSCG